MTRNIPVTGALAAMDERPSQPAADAPTLFAGKLWFWALMPLLTGLDLWSKAAVFAHLESAQPTVPEAQRITPVWEGMLSFSLTSWRNTGTIWGIGQEYNLPLTILRCVAVLLLGAFLWRTPRHKLLQQIVLAMIIAGALGNLYDNFWQPLGGVRDFLLFYITIDGQITSWPAFNLADSLICVGAILLVIMVWLGDRAKARSTLENSR